MRLTSWPAIAAILVTASAAGAQSVQFPGCFDVRLGIWSPVVELRGDSLYAAPPPRVHLDTIQGIGTLDRSRGFDLKAAPRAVPSVHRYSWWERIAHDSLVLVWSNGFSGLNMRLQMQPAVLQGKAYTFWDFGRTPQTADVKLMPVSCDTELPEASTARYRYPRGLGLEGADSLVLDVRIPSALQAGIVSTLTFRIHPRPVAPFQEATNVRAIVDSAMIVRQIRLEMPIPYDTLLNRMKHAYGEPTSSTRSQTGLLLALWSARMITISASGREVGSPVSVTFRTSSGR
jgi:hypothetical protein